MIREDWRRSPARTGAAPGSGALPGFGAFVRRTSATRGLLVQPRMGMADPAAMRTGLRAVKSAKCATVGTITLDSYTRCDDDQGVKRALAAGGALNGYPIVVHSSAITAELVASIIDDEFAIQVRHGSPAPLRIFRAMAAAGLVTTEGGPLSYCLPYSRIPVTEAAQCWARGCEFLSGLSGRGPEPHLESFGGCMMGQMCPPSLLVAICLLEALFFRQHGLRSISLSYAQQANAEQDREAIAALRSLAGELLADVDWHVVLYAYMGVYPRTPAGARLLLEHAAELAVRSGAERLIVKTIAEAHRIPTVAENIEALELAARAGAAAAATRPACAETADTGIHAEARMLVDAVLEIDSDLGTALPVAVRRGLLDVPYCLHPENRGRTRTYLDRDGRLYWSELGGLPLPASIRYQGASRAGSGDFLHALNHVAHSYDARPLTHLPQRAIR